MPDRLQVYGKCPKCGHQVTKQAEPGKVTWRGDCGKNGCDGKVIARRQRTPDQPTEPATEPAKKTARKVQKVGYRTNDPTPNVHPTGQPSEPPTQPADPGKPGGTDPKPDVQPTVEPPKRPKLGKRQYPYGGLFGW